MNPQIITVAAPSADPKHIDFGKLLSGLAAIVSNDAPVILNLVPNPKVAVAVAISEIGLSVATQIANLLHQLHGADAQSAPAQ